MNNLPSNITSEQLWKIFDKYGPVWKVIQNDESSAYVIYETWKDTLAANYVLKEEKKLRINEKDINVMLIDKKPKEEAVATKGA